MVLDIDACYRFTFFNFLKFFNVFTALRGMQTRSSDYSVRPSVRLSVKRVDCLDFYIKRKIIYPSFLRRRMVGGGNPFCPKFWVNRPPLERNRRF